MLLFKKIVISAVWQLEKFNCVIDYRILRNSLPVASCPHFRDLGKLVVRELKPNFTFIVKISNDTEQK